MRLASFRTRPGEHQCCGVHTRHGGRSQLGFTGSVHTPRRPAERRQVSPTLVQVVGDSLDGGQPKSPASKARRASRSGRRGCRRWRGEGCTGGAYRRAARAGAGAGGAAESGSGGDFRAACICARGPYLWGRSIIQTPHERGRSASTGATKSLLRVEGPTDLVNPSWKS